MEVFLGGSLAWVLAFAFALLPFAPPSDYLPFMCAAPRRAFDLAVRGRGFCDMSHICLLLT